jgi:hypothetical protein
MQVGNLRNIFKGAQRMKRYWLLILLILTLTAACGTTAEGTETPAMEATLQPAEAPDVLETPVPTSAMTVIDEYPAPATDSYPAPASPVPTVDPYPAVEGFVWVIIPVGEQCADPSENSYASLQEAVAALTAAGMTVNASAVTELSVCTECGCPTSAHYRVQIEATSLNDAIDLGWVQVEDEE